MATCCVLLETSFVLSSKAAAYTGAGQIVAASSDDQIGGPNYPVAYTSELDYKRKSYPSFGPYGSATDLAAPQFNANPTNNLASADFDNADQLRSLQPPKVYQSTVGRVIGPARQASNVQASTTTVGDLNTAAGHHHGHHHHGKYYEYREVPKKKTWKYGYKRGNHKHHIERHEHGKAGKHPHFTTKVKWADKKSKGKGIHLWDYNHHDKKHYHHGK